MLYDPNAGATIVIATNLSDEHGGGADTVALGLIELLLPARLLGSTPSFATPAASQYPRRQRVLFGRQRSAMDMKSSRNTIIPVAIRGYPGGHFEIDRTGMGRVVDRGRDRGDRRLDLPAAAGAFG